jgi:hypothetical protein
MKRLTLLALALPVLGFSPPGAAHAQTLELPATLTVPRPGLVLVTPIKAEADAVLYWSLDDGLQIIPPDMLGASNSTRAVGMALAAGTYRVQAVAAKAVNGKAALSPVQTCTVTVGTPTPGPSPGPAPGPTPDPNPFASRGGGKTPAPQPPPAPQPSPQPQPQPDTPPQPNPFVPDGARGGAAGGRAGAEGELGGLHVLIVWETSKLSQYPKEQINAVNGQAVRQYLAAHCPKEDGVAAYRVWDPDVVDVGNEDPVWQKALDKAKGKDLPYVLIGKGKAGYAGPLPKDGASLLALLKKFGGE